MKYMLLLLRQEPGSGPTEGTPEFDAEMSNWGALMGELGAAGALIDARGLDEEATATTLRSRGGERVITDGQGERVAAALDAAYRDERLKVLATIVRQVGGDLTLAEEAVQDAFTQAAAEWSERGTPDRPGAWLTVTARRRAIDRIRREQTRAGRRAAAEHAHAIDASTNDAERAALHERLQALACDRPSGT
jgi:hypothetical protein